MLVTGTYLNCTVYNKENMIALIDGDVVVYRVGFASENQSEAQNCINAELVIQDILNATGADSYKVYLSDSLENNFRYHIDNNYKANRKNSPKPRHYDSLRLFLQHEFKAEYTRGQEADDALGISQCSKGMEGKTIIASIDKDLLQIPGLHYNMVSGETREVTYDEGIRHFYKQLLTGDRVDNIFGVDRIGPVKAARALAGLRDEADLFGCVKCLYADDERLLRNGRLLWIRRVENELWEFPNVEEERTGVGSEEGAS